MSELYKPLYLSEGGPPLAFACMVCSVSEQKITKTVRGMEMHLLAKHALKLQRDLPFEEAEIMYDCSICRRPVYRDKPHGHVSE